MKAETMTVALRESEIEIATLISSQVDIESGNCSLIEEHVAMIAYLQNELELLQLSINSSSKIESLTSAEPSTMTSSVSDLKVEVDIRSHSQYVSRKKNDESKNQKDTLSPPISKGPGLLPDTNDQKVGREFSHVQSEMRRFRSARDEAKVSLSKMAGRVAIVKDQLHEKVRCILSYSNLTFLLFLSLLLFSFSSFFHHKYIYVFFYKQMFIFTYWYTFFATRRNFFLSFCFYEMHCSTCII